MAFFPPDGCSNPVTIESSGIDEGLSRFFLQFALAKVLPGTLNNHFLLVVSVG